MTPSSIRETLRWQRDLAAKQLAALAFIDDTLRNFQCGLHHLSEPPPPIAWKEFLDGTITFRTLPDFSFQHPQIVGNFAQKLCELLRSIYHTQNACEYLAWQCLREAEQRMDYYDETTISLELS